MIKAAAGEAAADRTRHSRIALPKRLILALM
ncbi:unnamed protein product, partial [marine sediment metagenome]